MKRNISIDVMMVIGAIVVASYHSTFLMNLKSIPLIFSSGYIAVEIFYEVFHGRIFYECGIFIYRGKSIHLT